MGTTREKADAMAERLTAAGLIAEVYTMPLTNEWGVRIR